MLEILLLIILIWFILKSKKNDDEIVSNTTYEMESFGYLKDRESIKDLT